MNRHDVLDSIYLNHPGGNQNHWVYYRLTSLGGKEGDHIEICLVSWPDFKDIDVVGDEKKASVINPGDTGFTSAYPNFTNLLLRKWGVNHEESILIGMRVRPSTSPPAA
jgi:hypothetical protein